MMNQFVLTKKDENGVVTVTLNRESVHNAFNDNVILELTNTFIELEGDVTTRLIVLTGSGRSFCAGADLNWMKSMVSYSEDENYNDSNKLYKMFEAIDNCNKPIIGKINGHALGGGVGLLCVCDYVITHSKAKFGFTEVRLGLIPAVISKFCIEKIGVSHARSLFLSGEMVNADKALSIGLVHQVTSVEKFEESFLHVIHSHLKAAPGAAIEAKKLIKNVMKLSTPEIEKYTCEAIASQRVSSEGQEGMTALLDKRTAKWVL